MNELYTAPAKLDTFGLMCNGARVALLCNDAVLYMHIALSFLVRLHCIIHNIT